MALDSQPASTTAPMISTAHDLLSTGVADRIILGYLILFCAHLSVSLSNDFFDFCTDSDKRTLFSGGSGVLQESPGLRVFARDMSLFLIALSLLLTLAYHIIYRPSPLFVLAVLAGNLLGWYYSAPPFRFSARLLGEASTTLGFISMAGLGYFITAGTIEPFLEYVPLLAFYGFGFILAVELPDYETDKKGDKHNRVLLFGRPFCLGLVFLLYLLSTAFFIAQGKTDLAALSTIPLIVGLTTFILKKKDITLTAGALTGGLAFFIFVLDVYHIYTLSNWF